MPLPAETNHNLYLLDLETWEFEEKFKLPFHFCWNVNGTFKITRNSKAAVFVQPRGFRELARPMWVANPEGWQVWVIDLTTGKAIEHFEIEKGDHETFLAQFVIIEPNN